MILRNFFSINNVWNISTKLNVKQENKWRFNNRGNLKKRTLVYSEISFRKNSYYIETNQLICTANQLTGLYTILVSYVIKMA